MTRAEGDRIAEMVLALVREITGENTKGQQRERLLQLPEPTGCYVPEDVRDAVMRRSA